MLDQVNEFIGRTYDYDEMLNVPLIHVPGSVKNTISTTGGQIDLRQPLQISWVLQWINLYSG